MCDYRDRLSVAGIALILAILMLFTVPLAFSGNAERYVKHVAKQVRQLFLAGTFAAISFVVSIPVCWRGKEWDRLIAVVLILLSGFVLWFVLLFCFDIAQRFDNGTVKVQATDFSSTAF